MSRPPGGPVGPGGEPTADLAEGVQSTFGVEGQAFAHILPEHAQEFARYLDRGELARAMVRAPPSSNAPYYERVVRAGDVLRCVA